jgi:hypothetical protein
VKKWRATSSATEEDCADWWKVSGYWGKTTNQSSKIVKDT